MGPLSSLLRHSLRVAPDQVAPPVTDIETARPIDATLDLGQWARARGLFTCISEQILWRKTPAKPWDATNDNTRNYLETTLARFNFCPSPCLERLARRECQTPEE